MRVIPSRSGIRTPRATTPKILASDFSRNEKYQRKRSNLVVANARRLATIGRFVNLEVGEEGWRFLLQEAKHQHGHPADLQLGSLARAKLEHRAPRACLLYTSPSPRDRTR